MGKKALAEGTGMVRFYDAELRFQLQKAVAQQIVLAREVRIESRAPNVRLRADVSHRERIVVLRQRQATARPLWQRVLGFLPLGWFLADMLENTLIYTLIAGFPSSNLLLAGVLAPVTVLKQVLLVASLVAPLSTLLVAQRRGLSQATPQPAPGPRSVASTT